MRKYSGNPDFALPFWNYFDYQVLGKEELYLPPPVTTNPEENTLFDNVRTLWLNEGEVQMAARFARSEDAFFHHDFVGFSNELERQPHGNMHCAVGNGCGTAHMGWVPVAGNDPIFYMHHANIDRLWQCWMERKADGQTIDLVWAKANLGMDESWYEIEYDFVDENGNRVTRTIADAFDPKYMPSYSNFNNCPAARATPEAELLTLAKTTSTHESFELNNIKLRSRPISVEPKEVSSGMLESVASEAEPEKQEEVGTFNFFGFGDHGTAHGGNHAKGRHDANSLGTQIFYISDDLQKLNITELDNILVHFVPVNAVTGQMVDSGNASPITVSTLRVVEVD